MSNSEPFSSDSSAAANRRLAIVLQSHQEISSVIKQAASDLPAAHKIPLLSLSRWFDNPVTPEQVLGRPDALSICYPLLQSSKSSDESVSRWQIEDAVHQSLDTRYSPLPQSRHLFTLLVYPLMLLLLCGLLLIGFSLFLVPEFEQMYREFGLALPPATNFVIDLSHLIRDWGLEMLALFVLAIVVIWVVKWHTGNTGGMLASERESTATWPWHVGLLLQFGLSQADAIARAGEASGRIALRRHSADWAEQLRAGFRPFETLIDGRPRPLHMEALNLNNSTDQSAMLYEVAAINRERDQIISCWRWGWLTPAIVCFVGMLIGLIVTGLFMPMVELISGLSS